VKRDTARGKGGPVARTGPAMKSTRKSSGPAVDRARGSRTRVPPFPRSLGDAASRPRGEKEVESRREAGGRGQGGGGRGEERRGEERRGEERREKAP